MSSHGVGRQVDFGFGWFVICASDECNIVMYLAPHHMSSISQLFSRVGVETRGPA